MALRFMKPLLVILAVIMPVIIAKFIYRKQFNEWFATNENSYFSIGFPVTFQGYGLSLAVILVVVALLMIVNNYF